MKNSVFFLLVAALTVGVSASRFFPLSPIIFVNRTEITGNISGYSHALLQSLDYNSSGHTDFCSLSTQQNITANKGIYDANLTFFNSDNKTFSIGKAGGTILQTLGGNGFNGGLRIFASTGSEWFSVGNVAGQVSFNQQGGSTIVATATAWDGRMNIGTLSAGSAALVLSGISGQTHNIFEVNSNGNLSGDYLFIDKLGQLEVGVKDSTAYAAAKAIINGSLFLGGPAQSNPLRVNGSNGPLATFTSAGDLGQNLSIGFQSAVNNWQFTTDAGRGIDFRNNTGSRVEIDETGTTNFNGSISGQGAVFSNNVTINGNASIGSQTNNLTINSTGRLLLAGNARVLKELVIPVSRLTLGASAPTATTRAVGASGTVKIPVLSFSKTTEQETYGEIHIPSDADESVNVSLHLMWIPGAGYTTGNYAWNFTYLVKNDDGDDSVGVPLNVSTQVTPANATQLIETHFVTTIDANAQQVIQFRFFRDVAADNADDTGEVRFLEVEYTANKLGE